MLNNETELKKEAIKLGLECVDSFYKFFITFWPEMSGDEYIDAAHIRYLCDVIQEKAMPVIRGEKSMETLIINVPPGSSKSTIATIAFPMWVWTNAPYLASTNVSYSDTLSARHAKKARDITDSAKWHVLFDDIFEYKFGKKFEITTQNKKAIENNFKGERFNTSVGGTITGMHADFIIKDDMQNPKTAKSDTERESANEWDGDTLTSRHKKPNCFLDIIIAQRLHESDLCGYTLNKNINISHVCLPSEINNASKVIPESAIDIYTEGILDPNRRPREVLDLTKNQMGSSEYTCQYLQAPFNLEEQDITPSMFNIIESYPDNITFDVWVDGAYTEKTENDPTGIDIIAKHNNGLIIKKAYDVRKKIPDLMRFIKELEAAGQFDKQKSRIFIEPKASGISLAQLIEADTSYNFVLIGEHSKNERKLVQEGKKARHEMIKPKVESGRISLVKGTWNDGYTTQICGFPRAAHDEHVDNLGYACNHYFMNEKTFVEDYAINNIEVMAGFNAIITSDIGKRVVATFEENDSGDVVLYDYPNKLYKHRYICVLVLRDYTERSETTITVFDRKEQLICASFRSSDIDTPKATIKALEMAAIYQEAKLVVVNKVQNEISDMAHMAIAKIREIGYSNIYFRLKVHDIKLKKQKEYGFEYSTNSAREVFFNLKEKLEAATIKDLPEQYHEEISLLERKKETGEIGAKEGYEINNLVGLSIALKVDSEMYDKVVVNRR